MGGKILIKDETLKPMEFRDWVPEFLNYDSGS